MVERTPSDDSVAAVLGRVVGDPTSDLDSVLARGRRARSQRAVWSFVITSVAGLAAISVLLTFVALRSQPASPRPAGEPGDSRDAISEGTYSTRPLSNAVLIRAGFGPAALTGRSTIFTLQFRNGTYRELQSEDGSAAHVEDRGTYYVVKSTVALKNNIGQTAVLRLRRTNDGFRVDSAHYYCTCGTQRRIARVLYTTGAAFQRTRTH